MPELNEYANLAIMSVVSILYLFIISKLLGKKQIAQLEFIDYIIGISIGSIAAEMATDVNDKPIQYYILAMSIFFLIDLLITLLGRKHPTLKYLIKGRPQIIIYEGKLDYKGIKKNKLDLNDVISLCRQQGYFNLNQIAYAILENNGNISILPKGNFTPVVISDIKSNTAPINLPYYLIVDGKICYSALNEINKEKQWMYKELNITDEKQLDKIFLATYNTDKQKIDVVYKN